MKRISVTLPDDVVDKIRVAAGGDGQVGSSVAAALAAHRQEENLGELLAAWQAESPVPEATQQQVEAELNDAGLEPGSRIAGSRDRWVTTPATSGLTRR